MTFLLPILANLAFAVAALGYGGLLTPLFPSSFSRLDRLALTFLGGLGVFGTLLFCVGQLWFTRTVVILIFLPGVLLGARSLARTSRKPGWNFSGSSVPILPAAIVAFVLVITAVGGFAEPVGDLQIDGISYHLVGSKVWLRDGIIRPIPDNGPVSMPSLVETDFAALAAAGGHRSPGLSALLTFSLLLLIAAALGIRCGLDLTGAWWVAALLASMPAAYEGSHSAFIDAVHASFVLAAARIAFDAERKSHFAAFGVFCGFAMATKYPSLLALPAILVCALWPWAGFARANFRELLTKACIVVSVASLVAVPCYLRNWILLGSPIYPPPAWVTRFLHVKYFSADALHAFYAWSIRRGHGHGHDFLALLVLPFNLTYHTADFHGAGGIGLAPLALGPLGVIGAWRDFFSRRLAFLGLLLTLLWFVTLQESRYLTHVYAISAIFGVIGWNYAVGLASRRAAVLSGIVVTCSVLYGLFMIAETRKDDLHAVFSASYAQERRQTEIPFLESFDFINSDPSVTRLLILDPSVPAYYSDKDYLKPFGQWGEQALPDASTPAEVLARLGELRVSHILDVQWSISGFRVPPNFPGLVLVFSRPDQRVYRVVAPK